ncbi:MAG TPA: MBL fold metallo-hydrolase [Gaiellaceae bacterium]
MQVTIWGCRGSLATPGPSTVRYGGNTTSVEVRTQSGRLVVLDGGTGIRPLGLSLAERPARIDLILTHLHLDHVEGLGFFAPLFDSDCAITIWGPAQDGPSLSERVAAYLSPPLFPLPFEQFGERIEFHECGEETWQLDGLNVTAARVRHPGTTYGYRIEEDGRVFTFIPDNEPGLDPTSGLELAAGADVLFHDAQYTADEYATRGGWGHSSIDHFASAVREAAPGRAVMVHHDPTHDDDTLERMCAKASTLAGRSVELGREGVSFAV